MQIQPSKAIESSEKQIILTLAGGDLKQGFSAVSAELILDPHPSQRLKVSGHLPAAQSLSQTYLSWREHYLALQDRFRIQLIPESHPNQVSFARFEQLCQQMGAELNQWLSQPEFRRIDQQIRLYLTPEDSICVLLETDCPEVRRLPWHLWSLLRDYPRAELGLGDTNYRPAQIRSRHRVLAHRPGDRPSDRPSDQPSAVRVLAILGDGTGIDIEADRALFLQLPEAQTRFLVEPTRSQLDDALWDERGWDILFFAGHSQSQADGSTGKIAINPRQSLTIEQLEHALAAAIARGLQFAIFNSCDGLGLARALSKLNIPQLVVMREPVPDPVAQAFLMHFLQAFAGGASLYRSVRQARQKLQGLEDRFLCASWLPVICQNLAATPPTWQSLKLSLEQSLEQSLQEASVSDEAEDQARDLPGAIASSRRDRPSSTTKWIKAGRRGAIVAATVFLLQKLGVLYPLELAAYDLLLRQRPAETTDPRILVVEVTEADTHRYGYPLEDKLLAQLLQKLYEGNPRAVGVDLHRAQPRGEGRAALLEQFRQHPSLSTVCWSGGRDRNYATPPEFDPIQQTQQLAFSDLLPDSRVPWAEQGNGPIRRQLLSLDPSLGERSDCTATRGLSLHLAQEFLLAENRAIRLDQQENWILNETTFPALPRHFGAYSSLGGLSSQVMINYRAAEPGQRVSFGDVLQGQLPASAVRDRVVLIGTTAPIGKDLVMTPLGQIPGVWVHAHQLSQLISTALDQRPLIWAFSPWVNGLCLLLWGGFASSIGVWVGGFGSISRLQMGGILLGGCVVLGMVSAWAIAPGLWLPLVPLLLVWISACGWGFWFKLQPSGRHI